MGFYDGFSTVDHCTFKALNIVVRSTRNGQLCTYVISQRYIYYINCITILPKDISIILNAYDIR